MHLCSWLASSCQHDGACAGWEAGALRRPRGRVPGIPAAAAGAASVPDPFMRTKDHSHGCGLRLQRLCSEASVQPTYKLYAHLASQLESAQCCSRRCLLAKLRTDVCWSAARLQMLSSPPWQRQHHSWRICSAWTCIMCRCACARPQRVLVLELQASAPSNTAPARCMQGPLAICNLLHVCR